MARLPTANCVPHLSDAGHSLYKPPGFRAVPRIVRGLDGKAIEKAIEGERTDGFESSRHPHLHAVSRAVAGGAVLAFLRRQRAIPHRRYDAVLCHVGCLPCAVAGLRDARALACAAVPICRAAFGALESSL